MDSWKFEEEDARYSLDLLTRTQHWRAQHPSLMPILEYLGQADLGAASQSTSVKTLLAGEGHLLRCASDQDYDRHVSWLYQMTYANPNRTAAPG